MTDTTAATQPSVGTPTSVRQPTRPWHRWFARVWLDYVFAALVVGVLSQFLAPNAAFLSSDYGIMLLAAAFWVLAETVFIASIGTTPGKYLVGIRVETRDGKALSLAQSGSRALAAWAVGCGLMLPLVPLFTLSHQYNRLKRGQGTSWDDRNGFVTHHSPLSPQRKVLLIVVVLAVLGLMIVGTAASIDS